MQLEQDPIHRHKDVLAHTIAVVRQDVAAACAAARGVDARRRQAADRGFGPQGVTFHHHEVVGARMTRERLPALRYPNDLVDDGHEARRAAPAVPHLPHGLDRQRGAPLRARRRRPARRPQRADALRLHDAQPNARPPRSAAAWTSSRRASPSSQEQEELAKIRPALDGNAVMKFLGVPPGPVVGEALSYPPGPAARRGPDDRGRGVRAARGLGAASGVTREALSGRRGRPARSRSDAFFAGAPHDRRSGSRARDPRSAAARARAASRRGSRRGAAPRTRRRSCAARRGCVSSSRNTSTGSCRSTSAALRARRAAARRAPRLRGRRRAPSGGRTRTRTRALGRSTRCTWRKQPVEVFDLADDTDREREVDRVGAQEREVARVALVPLDAHFGRVGELAGERELRLRRVERDDVRALAREHDRVLARRRTRRRARACP